ncbi:transcriptional regulator, TetR family protein [Flavobacteriales bacterium ALC-1]|nr:transcriptional regulator, TetR family protein [Flavobacteriales bacterium ALC-1]
MKHALVKEHIIKTASDLFYTNGYNSTGINEIIKEAGIAKATLYNHFKSKEDLCIAYLKYKNSNFFKDLKKFIASKEAGKNQILALFDYLDIFFNQKKFNGCWCINTISEITKHNDKIRLEILSQKDNLINYMSVLVIENLDGYSKNESFDIARKIYVLYEGAIAESNMQSNVWPINSAKSICNTII